MNIDYILNLHGNSFSNLSFNNVNEYENKITQNDKNHKNNENIYNVINNRSTGNKLSQTSLKSSPKELQESSDKKILGDINSLIKTRFQNPKNEDNSSQPFFLNLMIPANVIINNIQSIMI